jgi:hypothetical protein
MDWLKGLLSLGRLKGRPKEQTAGRVLGPASVQRTQLGLKEVDLPRGVVKLRSGEVRCFLKVTGYTAHHRSAEDARAWLQGYARALNTLPGNAVLLVRSKPGGLEGHIARQRAQTAALAKQAPGGPLARLSADQLAHARRLQDTGQVRDTVSYVALHSPRGDVARLLSAAEACRRHLRAAGIRAERVTDTRLGAALAADWHPEAGEETAWVAMGFTFPGRRGEPVGVIDYAPKRARVVDPPPLLGDGDEPPHPKASVREAATNGSRGGKALPR